MKVAFVLLFVFGAVHVEAFFMYQSVCSSSRFSCIPGQKFRLNDCNICKCVGKGQKLGICTLMDCAPTGDDPRNCTVGEIWRERCNTCCCYENIGTVCTMRFC